jgi:hypothetical protein
MIRPSMAVVVAIHACLLLWNLPESFGRRCPASPLPPLKTPHPDLPILLLSPRYNV